MNIKTLTAINGVLVVAVVILFVLHFSRNENHTNIDRNKNTEVKKEQETKIISPEEMPKNTEGLKIAYVNSDTVASYFKFSKDVEYRLKKKQAVAEAELKKMYQKYETDRQTFEKEAPIMGQSEMQRRAQEIGVLEQQIMQKEQELSAKLGQLEAEVMTDYVYKTNEYMQEIGKSLGYDYIMSYRIGGSMLYAAPQWDITSEIIDLLNVEYEKSKQNK